ncbi:MAG: hypothetical protein PF689_01480 [Deltaproteobacteria bacterium]|jgi:alpha-tubulin suppressor-like RCC1 family protein|nr:hypothetical protein [Deltaproteobacteria bacterium]
MKIKCRVFNCFSAVILFALSCTSETETPKPKCGDWIINQTDEDCDGMDFGSETCNTQGYYGGTLICTSTCKIDYSNCENAGICGDSIVQGGGGEECDTNNMNGNTCESRGYYGGQIDCTQNCKLDLTNCSENGYCGDGVVQPDFSEECDGNLDPETISCEDMGYYGGEIFCKDDCTYDLSGCSTWGRCGDGFIQAGAGEECDANNIGQSTCMDEGFWGGSLQCDQCLLNTDQCFVPIDIAAGTTHSCTVDSNGDVWCWGNGQFGQLGHGLDGTGLIELSPQKVIMPNNVKFNQISLGFIHSCALADNGTVWCWGAGGLTGNAQYIEDNYDPVLDQIANAATPVQVDTPDTVTDFVKVSVGYYHSCALDSQGKIHCWGLNNLMQLGQGLSSPVSFSATPLQVAEPYIGTGNYKDFDCGPAHNCAINTDNEIYCWGHATNGEVGIDPEAPFSPAFPITLNMDGMEIENLYVVPQPVKIDGTIVSVAGIEKISCGGGFLDDDAGGQKFHGHTCVSTIKKVYCWGSNNFGQTGNTNSGINSHHSPNKVELPWIVSNFENLTTGLGHSCATSFGTGWCWGLNIIGNLGSGDANLFLTPYPQVIKKTVPNQYFYEINSNFMHTCSLGRDRLWCWGNGTNGELGNGYRSYHYEPQEVSSPIN